MSAIEVPVLVVGAGPVGLMAAILLARDGREVRIVERRDGPQEAPAAHVVNARTLEIFRQAGLDMAAIDAISMDPADGGQVHFVTRLAGEKVASLPFEQQGDDCLLHTPTPLRNISQHHLEPLLARAIDDLPGAELHYGHEWQRSIQDDEGVTSWVRDGATGDETKIRSRVVIAADGAGSRVRKSLGIVMDGPPRLQSFMMIHFEASLRPLLKDRLGVLYWTLDPEVGQAFIAHDIDREWVLMQSMDPDDGREDGMDDRFDESGCEALVLRAIGEDVPIRVLHRSPWVMSAQVAERMRDGRIFLVGDAAHRFPPTGGLGLNSGVQDAHDLVWKLGATFDGWGGEALLDTYEAERRPIARHNAEQSLKNASKLLMLRAALGVDVEPTTARMAATLADPEGRKRVEDAISAQAEHFDMLGLQIGFAYEDGALVPDGSAAPDVGNPVREYRATTRPGARLPHAWVVCDGARRSTLDLVSTRGLTLISQGEHDAWAAAAAAVARVPIQHVRAGVDFEDAEGHWASVCELGAGGGVLVRPDQHVAWRATSRPDDPARELQHAIAQILA